MWKKSFLYCVFPPDFFQQIFNCILTSHAKTIGQGAGAELTLSQIYLGCSFPYTCQVPSETSTDRRIEAGWQAGRGGMEGQMDRLDSGARQDALNNTTKCQRTPHACSEFIVTKGGLVGVAVRKRKMPKREEEKNPRAA